MLQSREGGEEEDVVDVDKTGFVMRIMGECGNKQELCSERKEAFVLLDCSELTICKDINYSIRLLLARNDMCAHWPKKLPQYCMQQVAGERVMAALFCDSLWTLARSAGRTARKFLKACKMQSFWALSRLWFGAL